MYDVYCFSTRREKLDIFSSLPFAHHRNLTYLTKTPRGGQTKRITSQLLLRIPASTAIIKLAAIIAQAVTVRVG